MTISRPSLEIYSVDIPEINDFSATFYYNFFVPDESVNDFGGVPESALLKKGAEIDSSFIQYSMTRVPRFVKFNFTPIKLSDVGRAVNDIDIKNNIYNHNDINKSLIANNLDKIVNEDQFASNNFISVQFHDNEIDKKVFYLVSGSFEQHSLFDETDSNVSMTKAASRLQELIPVSHNFLQSSLSQNDLSSGTSFQHIQGSNGKQITNNFFKRLKSFNANLQINGKLFFSIINKMISDPLSTYGNDLYDLHHKSKQISESSKQRESLNVNEKDYKTIVPFIDLKVGSTSHLTNRKSVELVGYIIDKLEITKDGNVINHPPIIIENPKIGLSADYRIRYKSTYSYTIRAISKITMPAIDNESGVIGTIQVLVSSKPSNKVYVQAEELIPPPVPSDLGFTWNYELNKLIIHWTFPTNSQRDIKKFQIFRRDNIKSPFELLKMYDFDDSLIKYENNETPDLSLVEHIKSPITSYIDDDFTKQSKFIYAIAAIDAHGMTSNYSAQFEVSFNQFKNKLVLKLISHSGAPKPYPNLYLETDTFVDTIRVSGQFSKKFKLYFNPEYYYLYDDENKITNVLETSQTGGEYKLQILNLDNQKSETVTVTIDNQVKLDTNMLVQNKSFGKSRKIVT